MEKTTKLDEKILKLKQKRSKIDVEGLKSEKEKYTNMLTDYLDKTSEEHPEKE
jgi:low affinity Fe/Cu permease